MTVSTTDLNVIYRGNGATTEFAVPFKVLDVEHLVVTRRVYETGVLDHTYIGTEFTYDGVGESSGTLTLDGPALDDDYELVIDRVVPYTQELDIVNSGGFYPDTVEYQLDQMTMALQQLADLVARTPKAAIDDPGLIIPPAQTLIGDSQVFGTDPLTGELTLLSASTIQGDPGGTYESIGLFTNASNVSIPIGVDRVKTSGYSVVGNNAADYFYDATVDDAYVIAHPTTSFVTTNDRGFKQADYHTLRLRASVGQKGNRDVIWRVRPAALLPDFPVPYMAPDGPNADYVFAWDTAVQGAPSNFSISAPFLNWHDGCTCDKDNLETNDDPFWSYRIGIDQDGVPFFGAASFLGVDVKDVHFGYCNQSSAPLRALIILGPDGTEPTRPGDVDIGGLSGGNGTRSLSITNTFVGATARADLTLRTDVATANIRLFSSTQTFDSGQWQNDLWRGNNTGNLVDTVPTGKEHQWIIGTLAKANIVSRSSSTGFTHTGFIKPGSYTVATAPAAATIGAGAMFYVSNEAGGAVPAFSDGTNNRRVTDRAVIS